MSFDWQPAWLNLQYQKTPLPARLSREYVSMVFHIHSPWSYVCLGPCHKKEWHTHTHTHTHTHKSPLSGVFEKGRLIIPHFVCLCEKAPRSLVGVWPDVFPVVLYCRMWWRELCPMVVVLARAPLTRWLRRWNMLIKPKTTNKNLHQIVTLVVSGATVRFIYGETCPCRHACSSVRVRWYLRVVCVCGPWICVMRPASWCWCSLSDRLTRAVISAACLWQSLN